MSRPLPPGWGMQRHGLINSLEFIGPTGQTLLWCDGQWWMSRNGSTSRAPGVRVTDERNAAERIGREFIAAYENDNQQPRDNETRIVGGLFDDGDASRSATGQGSAVAR